MSRPVTDRDGPRARAGRVGAVQAKLQLCLGNRAGALTEIEEAWVVRALYREDGLMQPEIGRLMGHSKSWASRRLSLAECLGDELQVDLRIGLVSATTARELCRLPRDNQQEVATMVNADELPSCSRRRSRACVDPRRPAAM